jgi:hypothetical protein
MGLYSHLADADLTALRDKLLAALHDRLTGPTGAGTSSRHVQYQQRPQDIRDQLAQVNAEIDRRASPRCGGGRPIYMT